MIRALLRLASICAVWASSLGSAEAHFFASDGVQIHFVDRGTGETVVLIHGQTQNLRMWSENDIMNKLARDYRVVALDVRGHGLSGKPHIPEEYGAKMSEDVIRLLDHLELPKAHMVGYSMGADIIGRLLVTNPGRILSATLGSGAFPTWNAEKEKLFERIARSMEERGRTGELYPWEPEDQDLAAMAACARGARYEAVTAEAIARVNVPILAIYGSEESEDYLNDLKQRLAISKSSIPTVIVDGATHVGENATYRQPEFLGAVRHFIESNLSSRN